MKTITVVKRHGQREPLALEKWQTQIAKICSGIADVSQSMVEIKAQLHFYDGITTKEIDEITLRAIVDLIDVESNPDVGHTNYQYVAGKQRLSMLRKDVYGSYTPPNLYEIVKTNVATGLYTPELLEWYSEEDWNRMNDMLDHSKDETYSYAAIEQLIEKYLVKNRSTKQIYETPQIRYMVAAATVFHAEEPNSARMRYIKEYYTAASDGLFTLATPVLAGLGTPTKQFSSCVLIRSDDDLDSIFASGEMMAKYASKRAGIGLEIGRLRPLGSPIRGGEIMHTGMIPFLKKWFGDLRSCSQGGIRNASATVFYPIWITFHIWDIITRPIPQLNLGFDTLEVYPDTGNPGTDTVDGIVGRAGVNETWATIYGGAGNSVDGTSANPTIISLRASSTSNQFQNIYRGIFHFKTSDLTAGATISAVSLNIDNFYPYGVAMSNNGQYIAVSGFNIVIDNATTGYAKIAISTNYGASFTTTYVDGTLRPYGFQSFTSTGKISISGDGQRVTAVFGYAEFVGFPYFYTRPVSFKVTSNNYGASWTTSGTTPFAFFQGIALSDTGQYQFITSSWKNKSFISSGDFQEGVRGYVSNNYGSTLTLGFFVNSISTLNYFDIPFAGISESGSSMVAVTRAQNSLTQAIFPSSNYGASFTARDGELPLGLAVSLTPVSGITNSYVTVFDFQSQFFYSTDGGFTAWFTKAHYNSTLC